MFSQRFGSLGNPAGQRTSSLDAFILKLQVIATDMTNGSRGSGHGVSFFGLKNVLVQFALRLKQLFPYDSEQGVIKPELRS
jgi:hypothetical protein